MATKFIFVTGGVVSGLGKGITAATIGRLLKARGLKVRNQKFDPYINVDPGMMSPTQHGEVFVTDDGAETDLDIGHYERFTDENLSRESNITSGSIYLSVITRERRGEYMGSTVQVVPHIINEIKENLFKISRKENPDIVITEIGGTVGDMESQPYLEAIRQASLQVGLGLDLFVHVTLIPYLSRAGEIKTKPTQHSVQRLLSLGIQPDILVCRTEVPIDRPVKAKIAMYCNVESDCVIQNLDVDSVYELPLMLEEEGLARVICRKLGIAQIVEPDLREWSVIVDKLKSARRRLTIGLVGKYTSLHDAYLSCIESLRHAGIHQGAEVAIRWINAEDLEQGDPAAQLDGCDGILVPGGFGPRGMEGMVAAARYARERKVPFFGIGLGMQMAVVEFARHVAGLADAHSAEYDESVRSLFSLPCEDARSFSGGGVPDGHVFNGSFAPPGEKERPMRRGSWPVAIAAGTRLHRAYGQELAHERHHHRWEFNNEFRQVLADQGLVFSGTSPDNQLVEAVEIPDHPCFLASLFHPEFKSRPNRPHPLFRAFVQAAMETAQKSRT